MSDTPRKSLNPIIGAVCITAVIVGAGAFYGGMVYGKSQAAQPGAFLQNGQRAFFRAGGNFPAGRNGAGGRNAGFIVGEIIAKDSDTITLKLTDGGSKIVFYSDKTGVEKMVSGTAADLEIGKTVSVNGTPNADGSLTAESVQLRPPMPTRPQNSPNAPPAPPAY